MTDLGVVNKCPASLAVGWKNPRGCIFEALDYRLLLHQLSKVASGGKLTVLPDPLYPTIRVNGVLKWIASRRVLSNDRMLDLMLDMLLSGLKIGVAHPCMASCSIFASKSSAERRLRMESSRAERLE